MNELRTVHLKFSEKEIEEIDIWRDGHGIRTRSEAIRQMIRHTLESKPSGSQQGMADKSSPSYVKPTTIHHHIDHSSGLEVDLEELVKKTVEEEIKKALGNIEKE